MNREIQQAIFFEDEDPAEEDIRLLQHQPNSSEPIAEQKFWREMKKKVLGEFAPSGDLLFSEHDNEEELYLVRYYFHEFRIGRGRVNERSRESIYVDSLSSALDADLYPLLNYHITLLSWLRKRDFKGLDYEGNYALH